MTNLGPEQEWYLQTLSTAQKEILQQLQIILKYFSQPVKLAISTEQISGYLAITNNLVLSGEYIIMASESLDVGHFITALEQIDKMSRMIRRTRQQLYFRDPSLSFAHSFIKQGSFVEKDHIIDINLNENRLIIYIYHFRKTIDYNYSLEEYQDVYKIFKRIIPNTNKHLPEIEGCIELEIEHPPMKQVLERIHVVEQLIRECIYNLQCFKK
eukprot:NODE_576_length_5827_cov_0.654853.p3 type:complete len:212 gc:universal NODE_576_length_5827_cov_0.654853:5622-4987(-)